MRRYSSFFLVWGLFPFVMQAQVNVSLILSDNYAATGYATVNRLREEYPELHEKYRIRCFSEDNIGPDNADFIASSKLIFIYVHQGVAFEKARSSITESIKNGGKVYALGNTPAERSYRDAGVIFDVGVQRYFDQGGVGNIGNMVLYGIHLSINGSQGYKEAVIYPQTGIYGYANDRIYTSLPEFIAAYKAHKPGKTWVGVYTFRYEIVNGQHRHIIDHIRKLEDSGFNVLPIFGVPMNNALEQFSFDEAGKPFIRMLVSMSSLPGSAPEDLRRVFEKLNIPVINAIQMDQSVREWENSPTGLSVFNRTLHLGRPEISGQIQPTVTTSRETVRYPDGSRVVEKVSIPERLNRLAERLIAWDSLQRKPNSKKRIALIYYGNPPGKHNIGASYLNVLPQSMLSIMHRLKKEGYHLGAVEPDSATLFGQVMDYGRNIGVWAPAEVAHLAAAGTPVKIPLTQYKKWFDKLNPAFRNQVVARWGAPDSSRIMTWKDPLGELFFLLPATWYGNLLLAPQPLRGWDQNIDQAYHDTSLPPHHQYIAFYLYLQKAFRANAVIHLGTHGTLEWLNGKEAGLNDDDAPEALVGPMVNIYPYIMDDVGEGLQAKRRGMAVIVDHLTPPFDKAGLNPELKELSALINDYTVALENSPVVAASKAKVIWETAAQKGVLKDLGLSGSTPDSEKIEELEHYLQEVGQAQTPFGMHTFGKSPSPELAAKTAEAIVTRWKDLSDSARVSKIEYLTHQLLMSGESELFSLINALNGGHVRSGQGNDPLRNPDALPTGKNFFAFDPSRIPSKDVYAVGGALAEELIANYRAAHQGKTPDKVTVNLWSTETIRHEGIQESQILKLLGVRPVYDGLGRVKGVELIPARELGRPRIDVVIIPSGLYRDMFPNMMEMLDQAVALVSRLDEPENYVAVHTAATREMLLKSGVTDKDLAERLAAVRMFSVPPGSYGTGVENIVEDSDSWESENQVADIYFNRMSHLYGQGFRGDKVERVVPGLVQNLSLDLMKNALSGTKIVTHSRSGNLYGALDNDDFYQYLGGAALAVRAIDGSTPDVVVTNLSDPAHVGQESLDKFLGREMKARYLNPKWINSMLDEGYAGGRMINKVVEHLWGWQVTTPDAVDAGKWQEMYETYVEDKFGLDIKERIARAGNAYAYQATLARMLETIRKEYWKADARVVQKLTESFLETVAENGLACSGNVCNNRGLEKFVTESAASIPGLSGAIRSSYRQQLTSIGRINPAAVSIPHNPVSPPAASETKKKNSTTEVSTNTGLTGYRMEEVRKRTELAPVKTDDASWHLLGFILLVTAFLAAFRDRHNSGRR